MIDLHMHTLHSDGELLPTELARRAGVAGYTAMAITDHVDESNMEEVIDRIVRVAEGLGAEAGPRIIPGVEITHVPPSRIAGIVKDARALGARLVVGHGETLAEPVAEGTNRAYIEAGVDILAHPGLISGAECAMAAERGVFLEISTRKGHSLGNGHVAATARETGARLVVNTDTHSPGDLVSREFARRVALGAGLTEDEFKTTERNAEEIVKKILG